MLRKTIFRVLPFVLLVPAVFALADSGNVPDSPEGFDDQYKELLKAYRKGDDGGFQAVLDGFKIPPAWFAETFGADNGAQLEKMYGEQHEHFKVSTLKKFQNYDRKASPYIHTSLNDDASPPKPAPAPPPASLKPIPPIKHFVTKYSLALTTRVSDHVDVGHAAMSWEDTYIYLDGKFRFFGPGGYPFWDPPGIRLADPCAKPGSPPSGQIIRKVDPVYPDEARQKNVRGFVRARLTIATDGSVKVVEITDGDALLAEAAKQAFMQWRYTPFMNCGKPVEMRTMESVKFPPNQPGQ